MKKYLLTLITACAALGISAQEGLHVRSYWSNYNIPLEEVDSITMGIMSNADKLPALMASDPDVSLFYEALVLTHMADSLNVSIYDYTYTGPTSEESNYASRYMDRNGYRSCVPITYDCRRFTAFVEPDSVYARYGINNIEDLKAYAAKIYDEVYPEDATVADLTDRRNSLNRFVSYHLLDRYCDTGSLVAATMNDFFGNGISGCFLLWSRDAYDCYETMMPYSLMKVSYGRMTGYVHHINRKYGLFNGGEQFNITGAPLVKDRCDNQASNGVYHCIDDIISYDAQTQNAVFYERMTFDLTTLSPEFANNDIRHAQKSTILPSRMMKNFSYAGEQHLVYEPGANGFWNYQVDELFLHPPYDSIGVTFKLPPMPAGTYQLCFGVVPMSHRGVVQFYIDDEPCGDPVDLRNTNMEGWFSDDGLTEEEIAAKENVFRELGWMKGLNNYSCTNTGTNIMRIMSNTVRRIVGSYHTDGHTDHYLRIQPVDNSVKEIMLDYIQITPKAICEKELTYPYE